MMTKHLAEARVVVREREALPVFWALVDCPPEPDACWRWLGHTDRMGRPVMRVWRVTVLAVRVAWYAVTGEYPITMRFERACDDPLCVRPSHVRWSASRAARRALGACSDGYDEAPCPVHPAMEWAATRRRPGSVRAGPSDPTPRAAAS